MAWINTHRQHREVLARGIDIGGHRQQLGRRDGDTAVFSNHAQVELTVDQGSVVGAGDCEAEAAGIDATDSQIALAVIHLVTEAGIGGLSCGQSLAGMAIRHK